MKRLLSLLLILGCGGALAKEDDSGAPSIDAATKDSGPKPFDAGPPPYDAGPPPFDAQPIDVQPIIDVVVVDVGPPCQFTICNAQCVDTTSDPNNCGSCNWVCGSNGTCVNSVCNTPTQVPPQGTCAHSLCDDSTPLQSGCDGVSCTDTICTNDSYCCTNGWDSICVSEVATYCSGYACP